MSKEVVQGLAKIKIQFNRINGVYCSSARKIQLNMLCCKLKYTEVGLYLSKGKDTTNIRQHAPCFPIVYTRKQRNSESEEEVRSGPSITFST